MGQDEMCEFSDRFGRGGLFYNPIDVSLRGRVPDFPLVKPEGGMSEDLP